MNILQQENCLSWILYWSFPDNPCLSNPCQNMGECIYEEINGTYICDCLFEYAGIHCEYGKLIIVSRDCREIFFVTFNYSKTASYFFFFFHFWLHSVLIKEEEHHNPRAFSGVICIWKFPNTKYLFICFPTLSDNPCQSYPCQNNATCIPDPYGDLQDTWYTCNCSDGMEGLSCEYGMTNFIYLTSYQIFPLWKNLIYVL